MLLHTRRHNYHPERSDYTGRHVDLKTGRFVIISCKITVCYYHFSYGLSKHNYYRTWQTKRSALLSGQWFSLKCFYRPITCFQRTGRSQRSEKAFRPDRPTNMLLLTEQKRINPIGDCLFVAGKSRSQSKPGLSGLLLCIKTEPPIKIQTDAHPRSRIERVPGH